MKHRIAISILIATVVLGAACSASAAVDVPEIERRANDLNKGIMCPVCPGESINESQNALAVQMRGIVRQRLADGWSEQQIKDYFVESYGPSVLLEPPTAGLSLMAWIVPPIGFAGAIAALLLTLRWMRMGSTGGGRDEVDETRDHADEARYVGRIESTLDPNSSEQRSEVGSPREGRQ